MNRWVFALVVVHLPACTCRQETPVTVDPTAAWTPDELASRLEAAGATDIRTFDRGPIKGAKGARDGHLVVALLTAFPEEGREFACADAGEWRLCVRVSDPAASAALRDAIASWEPADDDALLTALRADGWTATCRPLAGISKCAVEKGDHVGDVELGAESYVGRGQSDGIDKVYARMGDITASVTLWDAAAAPDVLATLAR